MRKTCLIVASVVVIVLCTTAGAFGACNPGGACTHAGCLGWFNWVSNSSFYDGSNCWLLYGNATVKNNGQMCTPLPYVEFGLGLSSGMQQIVHVAGPGEPNYQPSDYFEFDYWVQFLDPHHSAWNILAIGLYDNDTGSLLQYITTITGAQPDPNCGLTYLLFHNSALIGKNVRIKVSASSIYSDTKIRLTGISLWQRPY